MARFDVWAADVYPLLLASRQPLESCLSRDVAAVLDFFAGGRRDVVASVRFKVARREEGTAVRETWEVCWKRIYYRRVTYPRFLNSILNSSDILAACNYRSGPCNPTCPCRGPRY